VAGSIRRRREVVCDVDVVAAVRGDPAAVAASFARAPAVREVDGAGGPSVRVTYVDGTTLDLHCVPPARHAVALWRATGSAGHVEQVAERLAARGYALDGDALRDAAGREVAVADEAALYARAALAFVVPELREALGEVEAAAAGRLPGLIEPADLRGVLHCHSTWSDGAATVAEMADAARARGWGYLGITDHSQYASYAGGLLPASVREQHAEIDALNARWADAGDPFRLLKGIEADILPEGRLDYDDATLDAFDYVIGSVHSRFGMPEAEMTDRVCRAMDDPRLTVLGHPTGRLLLAREGYAIDMRAVIEKAAEVGAAIELNADPHRLDLDWRLCRDAKARGVTIEIGPDAHSPAGLDNVRFGVGIARKGWLEPADVLNARPADDVLAFARRRRGSTHAR
jgi:DNA polymerase (family 10)